MVGCAFEMEVLLDWAEGLQKHSVTPNDVVALATWSDSAMMNHDVHRLDRELLFFLNLNLTGKVKETFDTLPGLHGLEAWRRVVYPWCTYVASAVVHVYRHPQPSALRAACGCRGGCGKSWEEQLRDYKRCEGSNMPEHENI